MDPQEAFVTRLRRHRERNRITLDDIASETRVKRELLEAFERDDLSEWPRGLYARAWVRTYASAVGLDPIDTVDEFCRLFPHGDRRTGGTVQEIAAIVAHPSEYRDEFGHEVDRRRGTPQINVLPKPTWRAALSQGARHLWMRLAGQISFYSRAKRTPRTSS
ncbi:MAG: helix-turn-helix domain-containing protein [Acidobacteria bacterium]|nr:helix-turn-helix domain-containing protein [Acidobacteriota bacterium]